ncbi:hypothetical protein FQN54_002411 [Arachnomyces sp. PD_36]|nr:hypothetical protein FQN54_002411 [Arachnomyces sp. PD_36]
MKLRPRQSASNVTSFTPSTPLFTGAGVSKTRKAKTLVATTKARSTPAKGPAKPVKKAVRKSKFSRRAKPPASSQKKKTTKAASAVIATSEARGPQITRVRDTAVDTAIDPATDPPIDPAMGLTISVDATSRRNRTKAKQRECIVCTNSKYLGRNEANFPKFPNCDHEPLCCVDCLTKHALIKLKARRMAFSNGGTPDFWSVVTCPQCNISLTEEHLRSSLSRADLKAVSEMVTLNGLHSDKRWIWCTSETCSSGQLHRRNTTKDNLYRRVTCRKCGVQSCFAHREPWHEGLTCAQYDDQNPKSESVKSSEERIRNMTKKCPTAGCGWRIQKQGGCSGMFCSQCNQHFVWTQVPYDKDAVPEPEEGSW